MKRAREESPLIEDSYCILEPRFLIDDILFLLTSDFLTDVDCLLLAHAWRYFAVTICPKRLQGRDALWLIPEHHFRSQPLMHYFASLPGGKNMIDESFGFRFWSIPETKEDFVTLIKNLHNSGIHLPCGQRPYNANDISKEVEEDTEEYSMNELCHHLLNFDEVLSITTFMATNRLVPFYWWFWIIDFVMRYSWECNTIIMYFFKALLLYPEDHRKEIGRYAEETMKFCLEYEWYSFFRYLEDLRFPDATGEPGKWLESLLPLDNPRAMGFYLSRYPATPALLQSEARAGRTSNVSTILSHDPSILSRDLRISLREDSKIGDRVWFTMTRHSNPNLSYFARADDDDMPNNDDDDDAWERHSSESENENEYENNYSDEYSEELY
jgi:hypothetical protein